ncbi:MAG TPA: M1 family aminopeptidase [Vicinamibacterales bacterium]
MWREVFILACCLATFGPAGAQAAVPPSQDGVAALLSRLEQVLGSGNPGAYRSLLSSVADAKAAEAFASAVVDPGASRVVVRERTRSDLEGTLPGDGYQLMVEVLVERGPQAQLSTWCLDVKRIGRRASDDDVGEWGIVYQKVIGGLPTLHRLGLNPRRQFTGRDVVVAVDDVRLAFTDASLFVAEAGGGVTGVVVLGRGQMRFAPEPASERGQLRLFAGTDVLETPIDAVFLRVSPQEFTRRVTGTMVGRPVDQHEWTRANEIFREDVGKSYGLDLGDLSRDVWSLLPMPGDLLAEIRTKRFGELTYTKAMSEAEDISLFDRTTRRNIAVYASTDQLARRGRFFSDEDRADYAVASYDIDAAFDPARRWLDGRTRLKLKVLAPSVSTLSLKLADSLDVESVISREYGRLLAVRVRNQNSIVVTLPAPVAEGSSITLDVSYSGAITPQAVDRETVGQVRGEENPDVRFEESYLYSNQTYWYPQGTSGGYATATLRVRVPQNFSCVASGELVEAVAAAATGRSAQPGRQFTFVAPQPARYFACLITPLVQVASRVLRVGVRDGTEPAAHPAGVRYASVNLDVKTNPRLQSQVRSLADKAGEILQYYSTLMGDSPYPGATVAAVEWRLPGGHSPAYMAVLNQPLPGTTTVSWRNDPACFDNYPEFFVAHELAHQWWGQAIGGKNYHEQWLSEGIAQYFAALYAGQARGRDVFDSIIRRFRQWGMEKSDQGPIYLGYRVGHIKGDSRVFRAVVYNKSAAVLHMLRRFIGDKAFFDGLRRFYAEWRFHKAGSDDLRHAMEQESGRDLSRFFERWIYGSSLPTVIFSSHVEETSRGPEVVVRFDQVGELFDVPVTVSLDYADRPTTDLVVRISDRTTETRLPLAGTLRKVEANRDGASLITVTGK